MLDPKGSRMHTKASIMSLIRLYFSLTRRQRDNDARPWLDGGEVTLAQLPAQPPAPGVGDALSMCEWFDSEFTPHFLD